MSEVEANYGDPASEDFSDGDLEAAEDVYIDYYVSMAKDLRAIRRLEAAIREHAIIPKAQETIGDREMFTFADWLVHDDPSLVCEYSKSPKYRATDPLCPPQFIGNVDLMMHQASQLLEIPRLAKRAVLGPRRAAESSEDVYGNKWGAVCDEEPTLLSTPYAVLAWHWDLHLTRSPRVIAARLLHGLRKAAVAGMDEVVIIRGGGDPSAFTAFEDPAVVEAVRRCPLPVMLALGHTSTTTALDDAATAVFAVPGNISQLDRLRFRIGGRSGEAARQTILDLLSLAHFRGHG